MQGGAMMVELDRIICGDCLEVLKTLPAESVDCCITSPPYYGLRDYGIGGQIGLEPTPEAYVARLVDVFREVRRVLKPEGTLWLNLGDSYSSLLRSGRKESPGVGAKQEMSKVHTNVKWHAGDGSKFQWTLPGGQKPKDLIGVPWMVAFALRADGWWLRSDIIWANLSMVRPFQSPKPNCMPESCKDRPTKAHEYIFLLSKSQKYYYDGEAIKEPAAPYRKCGKGAEYCDENADPKGGGFRGKGGLKAWRPDETGRNKRTVWTIPTKPYKGAHFATFPEKLVEPCILAGTSERGYCPECGKPWVRQVDVSGGGGNSGCNNGLKKATYDRLGGGTYVPNHKTIGWLPSCQCASKPRPGIVLDPFSGAGTVALVAKKLGRHYIGIELNPAYVEMAKTRINKIPTSLSRWVEGARQC